MACEAWKVEFNGCLLPEVFFSYDAAKAYLRNLEENSCAGYGRVVIYYTETGEVW